MTPTRLEGDAIVWACGSWLRDLFGELVALRVTLQEQLFFDGGPGWRRPPGWITTAPCTGPATWTGSGSRQRSTWRARRSDPDADLPDTAATERDVRAYLATASPRSRQPPTGGASCRYELTADSNFIAAEHPEAPGVWLVEEARATASSTAPQWRSGWPRLSTADPLPAYFGLGERARSRSMRTAGSA